MKNHHLYHIFLIITFSFFIISCDDENTPPKQTEEQIEKSKTKQKRAADKLKKEKDKLAKKIADKLTNDTSKSTNKKVVNANDGSKKLLQKTKIEADAGSDVASGTDSDVASGTDSNVVSGTDSNVVSGADSNVAPEGSDPSSNPEVANLDTTSMDIPQINYINNEKLIYYLQLIPFKFEIEDFKIAFGSCWFFGCDTDVHIEVYNNRNKNDLQVLFRVTDSEEDDEEDRESFCSLLTFDSMSTHTTKCYFNDREEDGIKVSVVPRDIENKGRINKIGSIYAFSAIKYNDNNFSLLNFSYGKNSDSEKQLQSKNVTRLTIQPSGKNFTEGLKSCGFTS